MRLLRQLGNSASFLLFVVWHIIVFLFVIILCGVPLLLLAEWCFPDYVHVLNRNITVETVVNLIDEKKYSEAVWLIEKKQKSIDGFNSSDFLKIKLYEYRAQMAVGNFRSAERCIEQMDSVTKEVQTEKSDISRNIILDYLEVGLCSKTNNYAREQQICFDYFKYPNKHLKEIECLIASENNSDNVRDKAKQILNHFRLMYLSSLTRTNYVKGKSLYKVEIKRNNSDLLWQISLYGSLAQCAMLVDSVQDVRGCYTFIKKYLSPGKRMISGVPIGTLKDFLLMASYLHEEKNVKYILPYIENSIDASFVDDELAYHELVACCIPYWDINGDYKKSNDALRRQGEFLSDMLSRNFLFYGEEQRENIYNLYRPILEASFLHLSKDWSDKAANVAYNNILFSKGLLLRSSEQILNAVAQSNDETVKHTYEELLDKKKIQIEYESLEGIANKYKLKQIKKDIAEIEKQLSLYSYQYRSILARNMITYEDVRQKLQDDEACIEFVIDKNDHYYALIGRKDYNYPKVVRLTDVDKILSSSGAEIYANEYFADQIWRDISKHLNEIKTVYYSPVGNLCRIPFEALSYQGAFLIDKYHMVMVSSTADIHSSFPQRYKTAFIMGDVRYSATDSLMLANEDFRIKGVNEHSFLLSIGDDETNAVFQMLRSSGVKTNLYTRLDASEERFKSLSGNSTDIIHLSTHGFYDTNYSSKPMKNCGLFLAGANRRWYYNESVGTQEDGIVTADEITTINLSGCKLVVLSACETGLGDIDNGEGVMGLQRAFKLAGVQSIMMSLWKVDNEATTLLMTTFYREWLRSGDMDVAFKKAKQIVREEYKDPYYWAAFVILDNV